MALRPVYQDFMQVFKFHAEAIVTGGDDRFAAAGRPQAGFNNITLPELTTEIAEYTEGQDIYGMKQPGRPTVNDCTFQRGVAVQDSAFWDWARQVAEGSGEYRATVKIKQYHRVNALVRPFPATGQENLTRIDLSAPSIVYHLYQAFPIRCKPGGDLDATASDISIAEMDVAFEHFEQERISNIGAP
jgi:phage tail-like protein